MKQGNYKKEYFTSYGVLKLFIRNNYMWNKYSLYHLLMQSPDIQSQLTELPLNCEIKIGEIIYKRVR